MAQDRISNDRYASLSMEQLLMFFQVRWIKYHNTELFGGLPVPIILWRDLLSESQLKKWAEYIGSKDENVYLDSMTFISSLVKQGSSILADKASKRVFFLDDSEDAMERRIQMIKYMDAWSIHQPNPAVAQAIPAAPRATPANLPALPDSLRKYIESIPDMGKMLNYLRLQMGFGPETERREIKENITPKEVEKIEVSAGLQKGGLELGDVVDKMPTVPGPGGIRVPVELSAKGPFDKMSTMSQSEFDLMDQRFGQLPIAIRFYLIRVVVNQINDDNDLKEQVGAVANERTYSVVDLNEVEAARMSPDAEDFYGYDPKQLGGGGSVTQSGGVLQPVDLTGTRRGAFRTLVHRSFHPNFAVPGAIGAPAPPPGVMGAPVAVPRRGPAADRSKVNNLLKNYKQFDQQLDVLVDFMREYKMTKEDFLARIAGASAFITRALLVSPEDNIRQLETTVGASAVSTIHSLMNILEREAPIQPSHLPGNMKKETLGDYDTATSRISRAIGAQRQLPLRQLARTSRTGTASTQFLGQQVPSAPGPVGSSPPTTTVSATGPATRPAPVVPVARPGAAKRLPRLPPQNQNGAGGAYRLMTWNTLSPWAGDATAFYNRSKALTSTSEQEGAWTVNRLAAIGDYIKNTDATIIAIQEAGGFKDSRGTNATPAISKDQYIESLTLGTRANINQFYESSNLVPTNYENTAINSSLDGGASTPNWQTMTQLIDPTQPGQNAAAQNYYDAVRAGYRWYWTMQYPILFALAYYIQSSVGGMFKVAGVARLVDAGAVGNRTPNTSILGSVIATLGSLRVFATQTVPNLSAATMTIPTLVAMANLYNDLATQISGAVQNNNVALAGVNAGVISGANAAAFTPFYRNNNLDDAATSTDVQIDAVIGGAGGAAISAVAAAAINYIAGNITAAMAPLTSANYDAIIQDLYDHHNGNMSSVITDLSRIVNAHAAVIAADNAVAIRAHVNATKQNLRAILANTTSFALFNVPAAGAPVAAPASHYRGTLAEAYTIYTGGAVIAANILPDRIVGSLLGGGVANGHKIIHPGVGVRSLAQDAGVPAQLQYRVNHAASWAILQVCENLRPYIRHMTTLPDATRLVPLGAIAPGAAAAVNNRISPNIASVVMDKKNPLNPLPNRAHNINHAETVQEFIPLDSIPVVFPLLPTPKLSSFNSVTYSSGANTGLNVARVVDPGSNASDQIFTVMNVHLFKAKNQPINTDLLGTLLAFMFVSNFSRNLYSRSAIPTFPMAPSIFLMGDLNTTPQRLIEGMRDIETIKRMDKVIFNRGYSLIPNFPNPNIGGAGAGVRFAGGFFFNWRLQSNDPDFLMKPMDVSAPPNIFVETGVARPVGAALAQVRAKETRLSQALQALGVSAVNAQTPFQVGPASNNGGPVYDHCREGLETTAGPGANRNYSVWGAVAPALPALPAPPVAGTNPIRTAWFAQSKRDTSTVFPGFTIIGSGGVLEPNKFPVGGRPQYQNLTSRDTDYIITNVPRDQIRFIPQEYTEQALPQGYGLNEASTSGKDYSVGGDRFKIKFGDKIMSDHNPVIIDWLKGQPITQQLGGANSVKRGREVRNNTKNKIHTSHENLKKLGQMMLKNYERSRVSYKEPKKKPKVNRSRRRTNMSKSKKAKK